MRAAASTRSTTAPGNRRGSRCSPSPRSPAANGSTLAIAAAAQLSGARDDELDQGVNLLADIRGVFEDDPARESLATYELLDKLLAIDESPWREWWSDPRADDVKPSRAAPRKLARTLKPFGIRPADVWMPSDESRKGYRLDDFRDAWARYLPSTGEREGRDPREPAQEADSRLADTNRESARDAAHERDPRGDAAQPSHSRPPRGSRSPVEPVEWLARDGVWRSFATEPPRLPGEVVEKREARGD